MQGSDTLWRMYKTRQPAIGSHPQRRTDVHDWYMFVVQHSEPRKVPLSVSAVLARSRRNGYLYILRGCSPLTVLNSAFVT